MSYADPDRRFYNFDLVDFGASDTTDFIRGPKGKAGRLGAIFGCSREVFTATTLHAQVQVGNGSSATAYAVYDYGTLADNKGYSSDDGVNGTLTVTTRDLPADTDIKLTFQNTTGGSPTGQATVTVIVDWER